RVLVIDKDRIPRILASRALKNGGYATMVTSPGEISQETFEKFGPDGLVLDHTDSETILKKLDLTKGGRTAPMIIIYSDQDHLDKFDGVQKIGSYEISSFISKTTIDQALAHTVYQALREKAN
ncbi:MAG: hypothetical protein KDC45_09345, partial [Bacteroidetes bacterium]|nr:hypothetical protein [Bacteroidota bacterium]